MPEEVYLARWFRCNIDLLLLFSWECEPEVATLSFFGGKTDFTPMGLDNTFNQKKANTRGVCFHFFGIRGSIEWGKDSTLIG